MGRTSRPEEIIAKLREVEVRLAHGETAGQAGRTIGVRAQTCSRRRKAYGELQVGKAEPIKEMEQKNAGLRRADDDLHMDLRALSMRFLFGPGAIRSDEQLKAYRDRRAGTVVGAANPHKHVERCWHERR
ncbi:MAG: hypothetical protein AAGH87_08375 [Pseudomonadota bacterium]